MSVDDSLTNHVNVTTLDPHTNTSSFLPHTSPSYTATPHPPPVTVSSHTVTLSPPSLRVESVPHQLRYPPFHQLPPTESTPLRPEATGFLPTTAPSPRTRPVHTSISDNGHVPQGFEAGGAIEPVPTPAATPLDTLSTALLAQQLLSLPNFSGEQSHWEEDFSEWLERLKMVANTCWWDNQAKLVNVVTRLRVVAARYYRSCTPQQRSKYSALTEALHRCFTPVQIQSVQRSKYHKRKQRPDEAVDDYVQELQ